MFDRPLWQRGAGTTSCRWPLIAVAYRAHSTSASTRWCADRNERQGGATLSSHRALVLMTTLLDVRLLRAESTGGDEVGLALPQEILDQFGITEGTLLVATPEGLLLKKATAHEQAVAAPRTVPRRSTRMRFASWQNDGASLADARRRHLPARQTDSPVRRTTRCPRRECDRIGHCAPPPEASIRGSRSCGSHPAYGFGLARNHGFSDGNKRVAFEAIIVFLDLNGQRLTATEPEAVTVILGVASGELGEAELAVWIRRSMAPRSAPAPR